MECGDGLKLVAKVSDPEKKQERGGAMMEGREIFCRNLDFRLKDQDIAQAFSKFGTVENVNIPRLPDGRSKGFCFVTFSSKEEAGAALSMNDEMLKSRRLHVEPSTKAGGKRITHNVISRVATSASPTPEVNGDGVDVVETTGDRWERTISLLNVPDTVNEARIRALVEQYGRLVQISLRPDHQGAIVEFVDVHDAGKASMALEGKEIAAGRQLKIGSVQDLKDMRPEYKTDRVTSVKKEKSIIPPAGPIKRPQQPGSRGNVGWGGRRGGLGVKRNVDTEASTASDGDKMDTSGDGNTSTSKKSNDDFRALLQKRTD